MAPRWFNNIQFGKDVTNIPLENLDVIEHFKANFAQKFQDFTFNSTGPIIEEVDDEAPLENLPSSPTLSKSPSRSPSQSESRPPSLSESRPPSPSESRSPSPSESRSPSPSESRSPSPPESRSQSPPESRSQSPSRSPSPASARLSASARSAVSAKSPVSARLSVSARSAASAASARSAASAKSPASARLSVSARSAASEKSPVSARLSVSARSAASAASARSAASAKSPASARLSVSAGSAASEKSPVSIRSPEAARSPIVSAPTVAAEVTIHPEPQEDFGPRRSQRKRWAPLDFARGERPIYKRRGATFEVVGFEPGFPANYNYGKAKQTTTARPQQSKARKRPANTIPVEPVELRPAKKGDYLFACRKSSSLITGAIQLDSGKSKPEAKTGINHVYMFLVRSGQVIIKTKDEKETISLYADEHSDWITLDVGKRYSIRNCGSTTAKIAYIVSDRVDE